MDSYFFDMKETRRSETIFLTETVDTYEFIHRYLRSCSISDNLPPKFVGVEFFIFLLMLQHFSQQLAHFSFQGVQSGFHFLCKKTKQRWRPFFCRDYSTNERTKDAIFIFVFFFFFGFSITNKIRGCVLTSRDILDWRSDKKKIEQKKKKFNF